MKGGAILALLLASILAFVLAYRASDKGPGEALLTPAHTMQAAPPARIDDWMRGAAARVRKPTSSAHDEAARPPVGAFGANVQNLKQRASENDAAAAAALAAGFRRCRFYDPSVGGARIGANAEETTARELAVVDEVSQQLTVRAGAEGMAAPALPKLDAVQLYEHNLRAATDLDDECSGVDMAEARNGLTVLEWMRQAAALGDHDAQLAFWHEAFSVADLLSLDQLASDKALARGYLEGVLAQGDWRALAAIAQISAAGYYAEPDAETAYLYYTAALQAPDADAVALPWLGAPSIPGWPRAGTASLLGRSLDATGSMLDPGRREAAGRAGVSLYAQCCSRGP